MIRLALILACAAVNIRTLKDSIQTYRRICRSGENHGSEIWSKNQVISKSVFCAMQATVLTNWFQRVAILQSGEWHPAGVWHLTTMGMEWSAMSLLAATVAWRNMRAFRKIKNAQQPPQAS